MTAPVHGVAAVLNRRPAFDLASRPRPPKRLLRLPLGSPAKKRKLRTPVPTEMVRSIGPGRARALCAMWMKTEDCAVASPLAEHPPAHGLAHYRVRDHEPTPHRAGAPARTRVPGRHSAPSHSADRGRTEFR